MGAAEGEAFVEDLEAFDVGFGAAVEGGEAHKAETEGGDGGSVAA